MQKIFDKMMNKIYNSPLLRLIIGVTFGVVAIVLSTLSLIL